MLLAAPCPPVRSITAYFADNVCFYGMLPFAAQMIQQLLTCKTPLPLPLSIQQEKDKTRDWQQHTAAKWPAGQFSQLHAGDGSPKYAQVKALLQK